MQYNVYGGSNSSGQGGGLGGNEKLINGGLVPAKTETQSQQSLNRTVNPTDQSLTAKSTDNTNTSPASTDTSSSNTPAQKSSDAPVQTSSLPEAQALGNNGATFTNDTTTSAQRLNLVV